MLQSNKHIPLNIFCLKNIQLILEHGFELCMSSLHVNFFSHGKYYSKVQSEVGWTCRYRGSVNRGPIINCT